MEAGLGLPDTDAWYMIETIADKNNTGYKNSVSDAVFSGSSMWQFYICLLISSFCRVAAIPVFVSDIRN